LSQILTAVEEQGIVPFSDLDIKRLRGEWEGSYRLRVGKVRVVFTVNFDSTDIEIYAVGFREDIYKQKLR
jgi:mRNA interferase RelE/StbE